MQDNYGLRYLPLFEQELDLARSQMAAIFPFVTIHYLNLLYFYDYPIVNFLTKILAWLQYIATPII